MGKRIPQEVIEQVKTASDIVDIIGEYVQLKKQGKNYFGLCPFHDEKTPSFSVAPDKQIYHCFGCKKGGNVINFLRDVENYSFVQAVQVLAKRSGIQLPTVANANEPSGEDREETDILHAYDWLVRYYHHFLKFSKEGKTALNYIKKRGISEATIDKFQLGYAPQSSELTKNFLIKKGYDEQFLIHHRLLTVNEQGQMNDPFRGRIIFPIRNHLGKTIAFGGRTLQEGQPKYINSAESKLFQKNQMFYNFDQARKHVRQEKSFILFEGQMDVLAADQIGIKHSIATLGTALTSYQARLLQRYAQEIILCYDADEAGLEATYRAANLLRKYNNHVRIVRLPEGFDPDDFIKKHGADSFLELIKNSDSYIPFYMHYIKRDFDLSVETERINYVQNVLKQLATVKSAIEREYYLKDLSQTFSLSLTSLMDEIRRYEKQHQDEKDKRYGDRYTNIRHSTPVGEQLLPAYVKAERQLIAYMLQNKFVAERVQNELGANFNFEDHQVLVTYLYGFYEVGNEPNISSFIQWIDDENIQHIVTELGMLPINDSVNEQEITDYITNIQQHSERGTINYFIQKQKEAEQANDPIEAAKIAMRIVELKRKLNQVK